MVNPDKTPHLSESQRLETLWKGDFGDAYTLRNRGAADGRRQPFWDFILDLTRASSILEVGCNIGANLRCLADGSRRVEGVDVNTSALNILAEEVPLAHGRFAWARELPFNDREFDLTFTMGVLIHQPEEGLGAVMDEVFRCSARYVLAGEYFAPKTEEVEYHGVDGALFKRDYGDLFLERFPTLGLADEGFLTPAQGWDDLTWWLFEQQRT